MTPPGSVGLVTAEARLWWRGVNRCLDDLLVADSYLMLDATNAFLAEVTPEEYARRLALRILAWQGGRKR